MASRTSRRSNDSSAEAGRFKSPAQPDDNKVMRQQIANAACHDEDLSADVCQPRVRTALLLVSASGRPLELGRQAAGRLRIRCEHRTDLVGAVDHLAQARVSCVLLDAADAVLEPMGALTELTAVRSDVPIIVLGADGNSTLSVAAVQAGAQDYLVSNEIDAASLERSIRYAIDRKRTEVQLAHLALHDHLTGLPNRSVFDDRLAHALQRRNGSVAVLFIDIDGFKRLNDSFGHRAGDDVLREAAARIQSAVRPHDTVARLGGDEFTVLCEDVREERGAFAIAERIEEAMTRPLSIDGHEIVLRASIGVTVAEGEVTADQVLQRSDDAMYGAKARGGGRPQLYVPGRARERAGHEIQVESALRRAIPSELVSHYQPVVALDDGRPVAAEALVRWQHPTRGLVPPGEFIPVAEESGLVVALGNWMLGEACRQAMEWREEMRVSVNVSGRQVAEGSLVASVARALEESGLAPDRLQLELTETVLMDDIDNHAELLWELKGLGVALALDDFGKGYSSLSYLHRFPVDRIKIDRAFVAGLPDSRADIAIVSAVQSFAGALGMQVVAEGVETQEHVDALRELGCEHAQGFFFHRPVPAEQLADLLG
jgi:diguanylate cyclase (GGDEF)-like protein